MNTKKLNCTRDKWRHRLPGIGSLLALLLVAVLLAAPALAANDSGAVPQAVLQNKPEVTIQGNVVVDDNGAPTGFYELALCVRSPRRIYGPDPAADYATGSEKDLSEAEYARALADIEAGTAIGVSLDDYTVTYYPFSAASAVVSVNTDVLTAVHWDVTNVTYSEWLGSAYADFDTGYPRGIDLTANVDPEVWTPIDPDPFPDVTQATLQKPNAFAVALDAEGDRSAFTAAAQVEQYYENPANSTKAAILTLSAHAPDNKPVVYKTSTPVAVVRFAYDLKRFPKSVVMVNGAYNASNLVNQITGESNPGKPAGFWLGKDPAAGFLITDGKTPLTWLADTAMDTAGAYSFSDGKAAATEAGQVVWTKLSSKDTAGAPVDWNQTEYYYYLGANGAVGGSNAADPDGTISVATPGGIQTVEHVRIPDTKGVKILAPGSLENPTPGAGDSWTAAEYSYYVNILHLDGPAEGRGLRLEMVNAPTFKKPTGVSGPQILFYDWDDTLIGSLMVTKGDVRAQVNAYLEKTLVHPDLRSNSAFMADESGSGGMSQEEKYASLDREYTYRGKYAYTVGGDDATLGVEDGKEYPLTNKLDYVFTKRVNTSITQTESGNQVQYVRPYSLDDPELDAAQEDGALYPWVYGWAVVEDARAFNGKVDATGTPGQWKVMHDAAKLEDVWTTMGVGELTDMSGSVMSKRVLSTVTAVDPAAERNAPYFLADADPAWTDGTKGNRYVYTLSGENAYLRFADFSDITTEMERYKGKDTLIVKAVYEPGTSLMDGNNYTLITEPAYTKWNTMPATGGGAYRVQVTLERSYVQEGETRGTSRVRMPVIQQDTTIDYKWLSDAEKGVNNDLNNTSYEVSESRDETLYTQVDSDNGEQITFSLALSPRQNRVDYVLIDKYNANFVIGTQRSTSNNNYKTVPTMFIPDNYNYLAGKDSDTLDDIYDCDFATKEGSHGFVLYGTLGHFLEQATQYNRGEISRMTYESAVTYEIAQDANLRMTASGVQPNYSSGVILQNAYLAAALRCEAHKNDPAYDCWDKNLDAAKLTYHQAQWFLLDYQDNPSADIRTVAAADADKLSFCHYHISCSGGHIPVPPTGWKSLVEKLREYNDAAPGSDDRKNARADLDALELPTLDGIAGLRYNANGGKYNSAPAYVDALLAADAQLKARGIPVNWPSMQYALLNIIPPGMTADAVREEAQEKYWWYAGANVAPRINDFEGLLAAAERTYVPVSLKDGDSTFLPKSELAAAVFPTNATTYLTTADPTRGQRTAWVTLTDNLVPSHTETVDDPDGVPDSGDETYLYDYGRFADMDEFLDKFTAAYDEIYQAVQGGDPVPADKDAWWRALQTKLLPDGDDLGDYDATGTFMFWWKGGNAPFRVNNLSTLVECVRRLNNGSAADPDAYQAALNEWNRLTVADIESDAISQGLLWKGSDAAHPLYPTRAADLGVGASENAQKNAILNQLMQAVQRLDATTGAILNWQNLQYLLLNPGNLPDGSTVDAQGVYYWWKNCNTTGTTVSLTPDAKEAALNSNITELVGATYRAAFNDPGVMDSLRQAAADAGGSFWSYTRLATQRIQGTTFPRAGAGNDNDAYTGPDVLGDLTPYAYPGGTDAEISAMMDALADFRDAAKAAQGITDNYGVPTVYWQQAQYYLFHKSDADPYIAPTSQTFRDLRNKEQAVAGDYWWYYVDERVPPEPPKEDGKNPEISDPLLPVLADCVTGKITAYGKVPTTITEFNDMQIFATLNADNTAALYVATGAKKTTNQTAMRKKVLELATAVKTSPYYDADTQEVTLYWSQIQYWWLTGTLTDNVTALTTMTQTWGWTQGDGTNNATKNYIPVGVDLSVVPGLTAELLALDMEELAETEVPLATDIQEVPETVTLEDIEDIQSRIEAMERELEMLKKQLAAMEAAQEKPETDDTVTTPLSPASTSQQQTRPAPATVTPAPQPEPETPETSETPETPAEPEPAPVADDHDERMEVPVGDEAAWSAAGTPAVMCATTLPPTVLDDPGLRPKYILVRRAC